MNHLSTHERITELLFMLHETNSQGGSVDGREVTAHVFIHSHLVHSSVQSNSSSFKHMAC